MRKPGGPHDTGPGFAGVAALAVPLAAAPGADAAVRANSVAAAAAAAAAQRQQCAARPRGIARYGHCREIQPMCIACPSVRWRAHGGLARAIATAHPVTWPGWPVNTMPSSATVSPDRLRGPPTAIVVFMSHARNWQVE